jgi:NAD(P)-dependent dehydrogenase (short-subunit alcohol dehydrogenase family)
VVNDVWGGDPLTRWGVPFWEHSLADGLRLHRQAVDTHLITSWYAAPLLVARRAGLIVEVTDGVEPAYRGSLFYDLAKASVIRLALAQAEDLRPHGVTAVALTPGFLRSEALLDHFGVTEATWPEAIAQDPHFRMSETPAFIGRAVVAWPPMRALSDGVVKHSRRGSWRASTASPMSTAAALTGAVITRRSSSAPRPPPDGAALNA